MAYTTPLSKLADALNVPSESHPYSLQNRINAVATAANQRIEQLEHKLSSTIAMATAMAQELQEIIGDANDAGSAMPTTGEIVDLWEAIYQEQNLIDEVTL